MFVSVTFIAMLVYLMSLISANKNNGDKFSHRKSVGGGGGGGGGGVDEKLIINKLGPDPYYLLKIVFSASVL